MESLQSKIDVDFGLQEGTEGGIDQHIRTTPKIRQSVRRNVLSFARISGSVTPFGMPCDSHQKSNRRTPLLPELISMYPLPLNKNKSWALKPTGTRFRD